MALASPVGHGRSELGLQNCLGEIISGWIIRCKSHGSELYVDPWQYWHHRLAAVAAANAIIGKMTWSKNGDLNAAAKGSVDDIGYEDYINAWRKVAGFGPEIKSRSVTINPKDADLVDEPKADITAAQSLAKKIQWSLNPNPVAQATEDAEQFLKLADAARVYPNYNVASILVWVASRSSSDLPSLPEYSQTWNKIVGGNETEYMTRVLGEKPTKNWPDGGITQIGDIVIAGMHDPKSLGALRSR